MYLEFSSLLLGTGDCHSPAAAPSGVLPGLTAGWAGTGEGSRTPSQPLFVYLETASGLRSGGQLRCLPQRPAHRWLCVQLVCPACLTCSGTWSLFRVKAPSKVSCCPWPLCLGTSLGLDFPVTLTFEGGSLLASPFLLECSSLWACLVFPVAH